MFSEKLSAIKHDLYKKVSTNRQELYKSCINNKLKITLERYGEYIDLNSEYLLTRSSAKVLKALTKLQKKNDKEAIEKENLEDE